ncbi:MAG: phosphatase PAP2 family protein [Vicingaceae bacterium]
MVEFDQWLFLLLNGIHSPFYDDFMSAISDRFIWIPLYAYLLFMLIREYGIRSIYLILFVALLVTLTDQLSVHLFKNTIQRLRPCHEPEIRSLVHIVNDHCGGNYGFISSHSANTFALAVYLGNLLSSKSKFWLTALLIWAALVSYSRIYLGVHYPLDILFGGLFGALMGTVMLRITRRIDKKFSLKIFVK